MLTQYFNYSVAVSADRRPAPAPTPAQTGLVDSLARTSFAVTAVLNHVAAHHNLSLTQLRMLAILRDRQPRMSVLADCLGLDRSTVSGLVARAEARGLLRRQRGEHDGRCLNVVLTARGQKLADNGGSEIAESLAPLTASLTTAQAGRLTRLLEQMLDAGR